MLSEREVDRFVADGYVAVRQAVPANVVRACQTELYAELRQHDVEIDDPSTWVEPVVRFWCPESAAFAAAGTQPVLWEAYDQLLGPGRHDRRQGVGGSVPVRFPNAADPGDAGWHVDGTIPIGDTWGLNFRSSGRGLLCLFLFSDVGPTDAPTELKLGSHLRIPSALQPMGEEGGLFDVQETDSFPEIEQLPSAFATGTAGDVFVCHPFLVHRATWPHRGSSPRFLAQPAIGIDEPFPLVDLTSSYPVERAIIHGLER